MREKAKEPYLRKENTNRRAQETALKIISSTGLMVGGAAPAVGKNHGLVLKRLEIKGDTYLGLVFLVYGDNENARCDKQ